MNKDELLEKARREYPVGTYIFNKDAVYEIKEELYWQYDYCISHMDICAVYDEHTDEWVTKCDKNGNPLKDAVIVDNYEIY